MYTSPLSKKWEKHKTQKLHNTQPTAITHWQALRWIKLCVCGGGGGASIHSVCLVLHTGSGAKVILLYSSSWLVKFPLFNLVLFDPKFLQHETRVKGAYKMCKWEMTNDILLHNLPVKAAVWFVPHSIFWMVRGVPEKLTGMGFLTGSLWPSPSWPKWFSPNVKIAEASVITESVCKRKRGRGRERERERGGGGRERVRKGGRERVRKGGRERERESESVRESGRARERKWEREGRKREKERRREREGGGGGGERRKGVWEREKEWGRKGADKYKGSGGAREKKIFRESNQADIIAK